MQKQYWSTDELPTSIDVVWNDTIKRLTEIDCAMDENGDPVPVELSYDSEARAKLYQWQRGNVDLCNSEFNERLIGIYSKLEIYISRFSLVLQLIHWVFGEQTKECVGLGSLEGAIELTEYFRQTAQRVQAIISNYIIEQLNETQKAVLNALPETFSTAEGLAIALQHSTPERTFKEFLRNGTGTLFRKEKHGVYTKIND